jgi:hypothetical protein
MSDENDPYYTDAEERREAINTIIECTKYWPCSREHRVFKGLLAEITRLRAELAQRTAERDEARRDACMVKARYMNTRIGFCPMTDDEANTEARKIAARMGWDCFAPHANTTDVPVQNGGE